MQDLSQQNLTMNSLIFVMTNISPAVRESIETESYRLTAEPDGSTEDYVMEDCFKNLIRDLETIGLTFDIDMSDYVEDFSKLSMFLEVAQLLLPNSLYPIIKTDSKIRTLLENIANGSIGGYNTVVQTYLIELAGLEGSPALKPHLEDFIDQLYPLVTQTEVFSDYIKHMIELYQQERPSTINDSDRYIAYKDVLKNKIDLFATAVYAFEEYEYFSDLLKLQNMFIRDLLIPDNFIEYSYLFLETRDELPEELKQGYDRKWYHYMVSHRWCYDYFKIRNLEPSTSEKVAIACYCYMHSEGDYTKYESMMRDFRAAYPDGYRVDQKLFPSSKEESHV